jgi:hypothetical protein
MAGGAFLLNVGSDGSDGDLVAQNTVLTIDLSQAVTASWDAPSPVPGLGVYDAAKWAVVFKYRSINFSNVTVRFKNHPSRAPVVWLVQEDVSLSGTVDVSGKDGNQLSAFPTEPGPGGFRGGYGYDVGSLIRSGGFGPGGGARVGDTNAGGGAGHAGPGLGGGAGLAYGEPSLRMLVGGSGGGGGRWNNDNQLFPGGAGGGAILIAAGGTFEFANGYILADGGNSANINAGGSGGSVRIVASKVEGNGRIYARGGYGSGAGLNTSHGAEGFIHVDAFESTLPHGDPVYTFGFVGDPAPIWPDPAMPRVTVTKVRNADVGQVTVPADPHARFDGAPNADVAVHTNKPLVVEITAENVPLTSSVTLRVVPRLLDDFTVPAAPVFGNTTSSRWEATFTPPHGIATLQARVDLP